MQQEQLPAYVCYECGSKYVYKSIEDLKHTTFHEDKCDLCGEVKPLCHVRNYNYLNTTLNENKQQ